MSGTNSKISNLDRFKRFLYLSELDACFYAGDPERYSLAKLREQDHELISDLLETSSKAFFDTIKNVSDDKLLPHRKTLLFILALAFTKAKTPPSRSDTSSTVLHVCKTDEEFFNVLKYFVKLHDQKNKFTKYIIKLIHKYFESKDPTDFAQCVANASGYYGWKYRDLIKLSHYKSKSELRALVACYAIWGLEKINADSEEKEKLKEIFEKAEQLRKTNDALLASVLISETHASYKQINSVIYKSPEAWASLIPEMSVRDVLRFLPKLYRLSLLKVNTLVHAKVVETLTSSEKIKACALHPLEVFIHLKNFEKGGKAMDPKLKIYLEEKEKEREKTNETKKEKVPTNEPKCSIITTSISKAMNISYSNVKPSGKRMLITIDVTEKKDNPCLHNRNITSLEAATAITLYLLKTEKDVTVAVYKDKQIELITLEKRATYLQILQKLKEQESTFLFPNASIEWAMKKKKHFDVFVNFNHGPSFCALIPKENRREIGLNAMEAIHKYRTKMNAPHTKLVTFSLAANNLCASDGSPNILTIYGLCPEVPKVLASFCRGRFS